MKVLGVVSVKETVAVPVPLRVPPVVVVVMSSPLDALRVSVMTRVYVVPLSYPWLPLVAPFASVLQLPLEERSAPGVAPRFHSFKGNGLPLPRLGLDMFIYMA